ncbi:MAG: ROK family glucokinase [Butyricicoccus sp.]|nr:ROK family glucokinase [Butyricicoccus sp.]
MKKYCIGADLGGTTVKFGLFTTAGELLEKWSIPTRTENRGAFVVGDIAASILAKMEERAISKDELQGVGLDVPGPVLADGTVTVCVNVGWGRFNVREELETALGGGIRVCVANDANAAALGEQWMGAGKGYRNVIMVTLGTGVGGGIIVDGRILEGAHGSAGEIGHMVMMDEDEVDCACNCGLRGCLEQASSASRVIDYAKKLIRETDIDSSLRILDDFAAKEVCDACAAGDKLATMAIDRCCLVLGRALGILGTCIDPEVFLVGGGMAGAGDLILDRVRKVYRKFTFQAATETPIVLATLGNDAGIYGSAKMVID